MKILDRYILREYLVPFAYCAASFFMLFVIYDLFDHLARFIELKTDLNTILRYYASYLVQVMEYLLPASLLLATLYALWRLTRYHELVAIRASGISLIRATAPIIILGVFFSLLMSFIKESIVPDASQWVADLTKNKFVKLDSIQFNNLAYYNPNSRRQWLVSQFDRLNPKILSGVKIIEERDNGGRLREYSASRAEHIDGVWWLFEASVQEYSQNGGPSGPLRVLENSRLGIPIARFSEKPRDFVNEIKNPLFFSGSDILRYIKSHPNISKAERARLLTDFHGKMASPWACAIVILFGIPAGSRGSRQNAAVGIVFAIAMFAAFYALSQFGMLLGRTGVIWPWLAGWLGNFVFLTYGVVMLLRMR